MLSVSFVRVLSAHLSQTTNINKRRTYLYDNYLYQLFATQILLYGMFHFFKKLFQDRTNRT
jgi:hypothetical protein